MITDKLSLILDRQPEPTNSAYSMYNTGSIEVEVGEFLYGLVRMIKPENILETGTHKGISTAYMASALKENGKGSITTIEYEEKHIFDANELFVKLDLSNLINIVNQDINTFNPGNNQYDFIFLDTEPNLRFNEFIRFWNNLKPGGFIAIHDLSPGMGQGGVTLHGIENWPFGTMPEEMKTILKEQVQSFHFETPRGLFLGQKNKEGYYDQI